MVNTQVTCPSITEESMEDKTLSQTHDGQVQEMDDEMGMCPRYNSEHCKKRHPSSQAISVHILQALQSVQVMHLEFLSFAHNLCTNK